MKLLMNMASLKREWCQLNPNLMRAGIRLPLQVSKISTYNESMRLAGLELETEHFEDYLSFLTEVLELELAHLGDDSMVLELQGTWLEIRRASGAVKQSELIVRFLMAPEEFEDLVNKISFFYYRKGESRFQVKCIDPIQCRLTDPDGRAWSFSHALTVSPQNTVAIL